MYRLFDRVVEGDKMGSFIVVAKELLGRLEIEAPVFKNLKPDIATEGKALDEDRFLYNCAYNLALAKAEGVSIICPEDSSYISLSVTKTALFKNYSLRNEVAYRLEKDGFELSLDAKILHIDEILKNIVGFEKLKKMIKRPFDEFSVAIFNGNKVQNLEINRSILTLLGANIVRFEMQNESDGYEILDASKELAHTLAGKIVLDAFDSGTDFIVANDARSFVMLEQHQKSLEHCMGREMGLSVFSTAQVVLMALGCSDRSKLGLEFHKVPTTLI